MRWKFLVVVLFSAFVATLAFARPGPDSNYNIASGGGCAAVLSLNGTPGQSLLVSTGTITIPITTTVSPTVIVVVVADQSGTTSISDNSGGTIGAWTHRVVAYIGDGAGNVDEYWAVATGAVSAATITVTNAGGGAFMVGYAFAVAGADTSTVFDVATVTTHPDPAAITTVSANTFIYGFFNQSNANVTPGAGWTQISNSANFSLLEYQIVSSVQTGLSVSQGSNVGTAHGVIAEAIKRSC